MKRLLFAGLLVSTSAAAQVPVTDVASLVQLVSQSAQLAEQLQQLRQQYEQLRQQYAAITGTYGRGGLGAGINLPASLSDPAFGREYDTVLKSLPADAFSNPGTGQNYKLSADTVKTALSLGEKLYNGMTGRLTTIQGLASQIDATQNVKDAADLQNRIGVEQSQMLAELAKAQALNARLSAAALNQRTQDDARNARFFNWR